MSKVKFMDAAIKLAADNVDNEGGPFGAVIVKDNEIIARGTNRVTSTYDPTAHAEVQAIREACNKLKTFDLSGCEIYTSCEPCPMCFSAIYWAHIDGVYYAADHKDAANAGFDDAFIYNEIKRSPEERTVPFVRLKSETGSLPFDKWVSSTKKIEY
ncbi:MAG: nucleoside deaminase [Prolixibacteraceae bacterium]|jgi:guanine deaminase|nr:nucleoside deaminase [Prolixibacteraceae bacterium]